MTKLTITEITEEAADITNQFSKKGFTNLESIFILHTALLCLNTWQIHRGIKQMEIDGTGGFPN